ncbi:MAG: hypothetical protein LBD35_04245 [Prevotellaceae bacterium]|jgi:hypothetical protein|nr:hypothetical protein [Prevotellaceae bacterium]
MEELSEIRFNENNIRLKNNLVRGPILPEKVSELNRDVTIQGNTAIEGPVYARKLEIQNGDLEICGAVFAQLELYVNSEAEGNITFKKSVGSANSVVSRAANCRLTFHSDINAKSVTLYNAFVAGSVYADEIAIENSVVTGGVFATQQIDMTDSIAGTFNAPSVRIARSVGILLPSAFSVEKIIVAPDTKFYNLSLADLGALYKGLPQSPDSGKIEMNTDADEIKSTLANDEVQRTLHAYTIVGKVLAADLSNPDKFQNHFLLTASSLGAQLLKTYDMGMDCNGKPALLTIERIRNFFFDVLHGKVTLREL